MRGNRMGAIALTLTLLTGPALAADKGSAQEAEDMVRRAVALVKSEGPEKAYAAFTAKDDPRFHDRDLYVHVYDAEGKCLAHGLGAGMVGRSAIDLQDADGKYFMRERVQLTKAGKPFSYDLKFMSPVSKKIEPKTNYCEVVNGTSVCSGYYK